MFIQCLLTDDFIETTFNLDHIVLARPFVDNSGYRFTLLECVNGRQYKIAESYEEFSKRLSKISTILGS